MRRPLNPRITNIAHDADVLDRDGSARDALVDRFLALSVARTLAVVIPGGVRQQVQHPHTPAEVKGAVLPQIFNLRPGLNTSQQDTRRRILAVLQGNARPETHAADASYLSEAVETGCGYFIARDKRFFKKREELHEILPPSLNIVTLEEFFGIFDDYETQGRGRTSMRWSGWGFESENAAMDHFPIDQFDVDLSERKVLHKPSGICFSFGVYTNEEDWQKADSVKFRDNPNFTGDRMALAAAAKAAAIAKGMKAKRPNADIAGRS